jgi:hypothetical protein
VRSERLRESGRNLVALDDDVQRPPEKIVVEALRVAPPDGGGTGRSEPARRKLRFDRPADGIENFRGKGPRLEEGVVEIEEEGPDSPGPSLVAQYCSRY